MKETRTNIRTVLLVFLCAFVFLVGYLSYEVYYYGSRWFASPYNQRLSSERKSVTMGSVLDRKGAVLAYTDAEGERRYIPDSATRRAVGHVVGDDQAIVAGGAQTFFASDLLGFNTNLYDRILQVFESGTPRGNDIVLTIDSKLQKYASQQFPEGKDGAVVVLNYKTGETLCMVSKPEFDLSDVDRRKSGAGIGGAALNRATQSKYAPGSIFKTITATAALKNIKGIESKDYTCEGEYWIGERALREGNNKAHGDLKLNEAFTVSCNVIFGKLGMELGASKLRSMARAFAFDDDFVFRDLIVTPSAFPSQAMDAGELAWTSVGQGRTTVTPLHMALVAASIANDGVMMEPRMLMQVQTNRAGAVSVLRGTSEKTYKRCIDAQLAETLTTMMRSVVTDGTGTSAALKGYKVCGKTGTAQVSDSGNVKSHAWFIGFIDDESAPYAVCVMVEHGGGGGSVAAPVARKVLSKTIELMK